MFMQTPTVVRSYLQLSRISSRDVLSHSTAIIQVQCVLQSDHTRFEQPSNFSWTVNCEHHAYAFIYNQILYRNESYSTKIFDEDTDRNIRLPNIWWTATPFQYWESIISIQNLRTDYHCVILTTCIIQSASSNSVCLTDPPTHAFRGNMPTWLTCTKRTQLKRPSCTLQPTNEWNARSIQARSEKQHICQHLNWKKISTHFTWQGKETNQNIYLWKTLHFS